MMTMLSGNKLTVLEQFVIDPTLPKREGKEQWDLLQSNSKWWLSSNEMWTVSWSTSLSNVQFNNPVLKIGDLILIDEYGQFKIPSFFGKIKKLFTVKRSPKIIHVEEFFALIKGNKTSIKKLGERIKNLYVIINKAKKSGQTAMIESIEKQIENIKFESQLYSYGLTKYVDEDTIVHFAKKTEKWLNCCYIKNFTRLIPDAIIKKKLKADSYKIFDNYVILFFDPKWEMFDHTAEEKKKIEEKKKDPILFGVIRWNRKLYYIGDRKDKYCNLRLEDIARKMGKKSVHEITDKIVL